jgi:hypothetical protein
MARRLLPLLLIAALALAFAGCGSSSSSAGGSAPPGISAPANKTHFAKTKFLLHAGLAFGVFHRWIYKPFKAGTFTHPLRHKLAFVKALIAGGIVIHEVRLALADARSSKLLSKVVLPLAALGSSVAVVRAALRNHKADAASINAANSSAANASAASRAAGQPITETTAGSGL